MDGVEQTGEVRRLRWLARGALAWGFIILIRLVWLQVIEHEPMSRAADSQQIQELELRAPRGMILDRNGSKLAVSEPADSIAINPRMLQDPTVVAELLARVLKLDARKLLAEIEQARARNRGFLWVKRKVTREQSAALSRLKADWLDIREESRRVYPKGTLAAHLLGSVNQAEAGNAGIELALQSDLEGRPGTVERQTDVRHNGIATREVVPALPGKTVALTIDERLQYLCDRALKSAVNELDCQTGTILVMDPRNGDVLAMSSYPTYDPNVAPRTSEDPERANVAVTYACEPGSVFKLFTMAAALETTSLRPQTVINCGNGIINLYGQVIHDLHPHSALPMQEVLWHSSNIGAVNIGLTVGKERLYEYLRRFGFGRPTGVPLGSESWGMLRPVDQWNKGSIGYVSFGHEVSTTTMQLAQAGAVLANGGFRVKPRLVLWRQRPGGPREPEPVGNPVRALKPETAITMRQMMEGVILQGTGKRARLEGYTAGGKTGTAQIFDLTTRRYFNKLHNGTFLGIAPLTNPAIVVVVTLNGTSRQGGQVAAPVFKEVASAALRLLNVTRDVPDVETVAPEKLARMAKALPPAPPDPEPQADADDPGVVLGPRVPDWTGKSVKVVLRESMARGLPVEIVGTGLARMQSPPAGRVLGAGERIRVQFAR